jgi:cytochrome c peroxidase
MELFLHHSKGMKLKLLGITLVLLAIITKSCRKDPVAMGEAQDGVYQTTPYVLEAKASYPPLNLPADNPLTEEGVMLGRMLFHDPILSLDSSVSCASCHKQNKAFTDGLKVSKGIGGQIGTRNSMALVNLMWQRRLFWDGRAPSIREQVLGPIQAHNEMGMNLYDLALRLEGSSRYKPAFKRAFNADHVTPVVLSKALEQFLVTLVSFNSKFDQLQGRTDTLNVISASALRGLNLFMTPVDSGGADCFHCHGDLPFFGNNGSMFNNGLDIEFADMGFGNVTGKQEDNGRFKAPSLRNVEFTAPYMHDGRFDNLEEVLIFYSDKIKLTSPFLDPNILVHNKQLHLTEQQKADIVEFLKTLSDTEFINDPKFKSPF